MKKITNNILGKAVYTTIRGQDAKNLFDHMFGKDFTISEDEEENIVDINTKVWFKCRKVADELIVEMEVNM